MEISTRNFGRLAGRRAVEAAASIHGDARRNADAGMVGYYSFNAHWGQGEMMGSMINGSGDEFFALFNIHGVFLKGFDHEATAAAIPCKHFYRDLPAQFEPCTREPAFSPDDVTFCVWRLVDQPQWSPSRVALFAGVCDGSADILSMLDGVPETYLGVGETILRARHPTGSDREPV
jgi:hypothetical protein